MISWGTELITLVVAVEVLIAGNIGAVKVVLCDSGHWEEFIDSLFDLFQQLGFRDDAAVTEELQIIVDLFQELLRRVAFLADDVAQILKDTTDPSCVDCWIGAVK